MKVPFGLHEDTKRFIGIDEANRGLACNCICPSCGMQLQARKGEERDAHFSHHRAAKREDCEYSYWVSVRSMAKQLIEKYKYIKIESRKEKWIYNCPYKTIMFYGVKKDPHIKEYQFDLEIISSIGIFYIYFVTDSSDAGRARMHYYDSNKYFNDRLVLEIDLSSMKENNRRAAKHLRELLFEKLNNKTFVTPNHCFVKAVNSYDISTVEIPLLSRQNKCLVEKTDEPLYFEPKNEKQAILYIKAMCNIENGDMDYDDSINGIIKTMKAFYVEGMRQSKHIYHNLYTSQYQIFHKKEANFYFGVLAEKYYAVIYLEEKYLVYMVSKGVVNILCESKNIEEAHMDIRDYYSGLDAI